MSLWRRVGRAIYYLSWPALYVYLRLGARTRVLVLVDGHVLLVQGWMSDGRWMLPGGGLHRRELPVDGVVRETAEEAGVMLRSGQLTNLGSEWCQSGGLKFYCHFFATTLSERPATRPQRGEIVAAQWFSLAELDRLPHRSEVEQARRLLAQHG